MKHFKILILSILYLLFAMGICHGEKVQIDLPPFESDW